MTETGKLFPLIEAEGKGQTSKVDQVFCYAYNCVAWRQMLDCGGLGISGNKLYSDLVTEKSQKSPEAIHSTQEAERRSSIMKDAVKMYNEKPFARAMLVARVEDYLPGIGRRAEIVMVEDLGTALAEPIYNYIEENVLAYREIKGEGK